MEQMRDMLRNVLGRSLRALSPLDRLSAAWPVAAGHGIAERTSVVGLEGGVATVEVRDVAWQRQLVTMRGQLRQDLARASRVELTDILFVMPQADVPLPQAKPATRKHSPGKRQ